MRAHHPGADLASVERAHDEAARWHMGQTRRSGDPYLTHCVAVAAVVADIGMPSTVICAALLHDVIEDTPCPPGRLAERFGPDVARLVADVGTAKLAGLPPRGLLPDTARPSHEEAVLAICLADRLHNMRTIEFLAPVKQYGKARQTIEVLVPLARVAGLTEVSRELHDLSVAVLQPAPTVYAVTTRLLALLALLLPGTQRARWRQEWQAELAVLPTRRTRTGFTLRVLLSTPRLSLTLRHAPCRESR
ncbi:HD domain-containing protein [Streptomyces scabiei]|uniref:HD domain-containing protein n=1 Tax=Streptomyces scabiei TaxID=1930 RepID=UPI0038F8059E